MLYTLSHEIVHDIRATNPASFENLFEFVVNEYIRQGKSADEILRQYELKYKDKDLAREEFVADSMESVLVRAFEGDTKPMSRLKTKCHDVWLKIREMLTRIARTIVNEYKGLKPDSEAGRFVAQLSDDTFNVLKDMYFGAMGKAAESRQHFRGLDELVAFLDEHNISYDATDLEHYKTKNTANNDGVRYSLNRNAKTELHKALYDKNYSEDVLLRDVTPSIMLAQKGVKNLPMVMNISHIRENVLTEAEARQLGLRVDKHTHYHGLGEAFYLKVIDGLDNITEAYRGTKNADNSARRENYFLLVSQFKDDNGNVVNVPVYINETTQHNRVFIDTNKISTVFGRDNFRKYISNEISKGNLVRIKNKSTTSSEPNALIAERYRSNASNSIIPQDDTSVNNQSMQNAEKNSDRDTAYLEAVNNGDMKTAQRFDMENEDIRYSRRGPTDYLSKSEWASFYESVEKSNQRGAFRIGDNGILIPDKNNANNYKLVYYSGDVIHPDIYAVYKLENYDYNIHSDQVDATKMILDLEKSGYNEKQTRAILQNYYSMYKTVFKRYNSNSRHFVKLTRESVPSRKNVGVESNRAGVSTDAQQGVPDRLTEDNKLYQARPDFTDILFDDFEGEVTDEDSRLITEYINGKTDVVNHLINNTRNIPLSEYKLRGLVSRLLKSYELSEDSKNDVYIALTSLLESNDKTDVKDNLSLLQGVGRFKKSSHLTALFMCSV